MKKFIPKLLLLAGVAMVVAACSKKDSDAPGSIVGKWSVVSDTSRLYDNNNTLISMDVNTDIKPSDYVQFNSDGSGGEDEYGIKITFNYVVNGSNLHLVYTGSNIPGATSAVPYENITIKHLDAHTMYTVQVDPDTLNNVVYQLKESIHFSK